MANGIAGKCYCGQFRYESTSDLYGAHYCYCTDCQAFHGAPFGAGFGLLDERTSTQGELSEYQIQTESGNQRTLLSCSHCFCPIGTRVDAFAGVTMYSAATLENQNVFQPEFHLWTQSKPQWHSIGDDLPQYETQPDFGSDT